DKSKDTVRTVTVGGEVFYVDDPEGQDFDGTYTRVGSGVAANGNYVVATGLSGSSQLISVLVAGDKPKSDATIAGIQIVGRSYAIDIAESVALEVGGNDLIRSGGGDDLIFGGAGSDKIYTFGDADLGRYDADSVFGDNGRATFLLRDPQAPELRSMEALDVPGSQANDDTIITGNGEDRVIGGFGNDHIDTGDRGPHNGVDDAVTGDDLRTVSVNFGSKVFNGTVEGTLGYVAADGWNNFDDVHEYKDYKYHGAFKGYDYKHYNGADNHKHKVYHDKYKDAQTMVTDEGIWLSIGEDLDGKGKGVRIEANDQLHPDTQNSRLYTGYIYAKGKYGLGIDATNVEQAVGTDPYDVYLYIDAEDRDSYTDAGFRLVSLNGETYSVADPDGFNFKGEFLEYDPNDPSRPANVVVFRDVTGDGFSLRIDAGGEYKKGKWYPNDKDTPSIAGMQIVGGANKDDVIQQGDFDSDRVIGDQGRMEIFEGSVFEMEAEALDLLVSNDLILTGDDGDVIIGGDGDDTIRGETGDDVIAGDSAHAILKQGEVIGLGLGYFHGKGKYGYQADADGHSVYDGHYFGDLHDKYGYNGHFGAYGDKYFDPFLVPGFHLKAVDIGGNDVIEGGRDDDWSWGGAGDDTYVFDGDRLGDDKVIEAGFYGYGYGKYADQFGYYGHEGEGRWYDFSEYDYGSKLSKPDKYAVFVDGPAGLPNDNGDALDFSGFGGTVDIDLSDNKWQLVNDRIVNGDHNLSLTLFNGSAIEDVTGSAFDDKINGNDRNNALIGNSGDDDIDGVNGANFLSGGDGHDKIEAGKAEFAFERDRDKYDRAGSIILGGAGDDDITGGYGDDIIDGEGGNDKIDGKKGADLIFGGDGNDNLKGYTKDGAVIVGGAGKDKIKDSKKSKYPGYTVEGDLAASIRRDLLEDRLSAFTGDFGRSDFDEQITSDAPVSTELQSFVDTVGAPEKSIKETGPIGPVTTAQRPDVNTIISAIESSEIVLNILPVPTQNDFVTSYVFDGENFVAQAGMTASRSAPFGTVYELLDEDGSLFAYVDRKGGLWLIDDFVQNPDAAADAECDDWVFMADFGGTDGHC
ncbi:MAG: hypothetical protein ACI9IV_000051, partial [Paracoccaceae bacterium]